MWLKKTIARMAAGAALFGAGVASAQTTTPGVPSTGLGGDMILNLVVLALAAIVAIVGAVYVLRKTQ